MDATKIEWEEEGDPLGRTQIRGLNGDVLTCSQYASLFILAHIQQIVHSSFLLCAMALFAILSFVCVALVSYVVWNFLLRPLPKSDPEAERAFLKNKTVWITGASSGIGKGQATLTTTTISYLCV